MRPADAPAPAPDARGVATMADEAWALLGKARVAAFQCASSDALTELLGHLDAARELLADIESRALAARADGAGDALSLIAGERQRQRDAEGWTPEHDDAEHPNGELARAAAAYALPFDWRPARCPSFWPWEPGWFKQSPNDRVRELVKAGALIVAEIERLHRAAGTATPAAPRAGAEAPSDAEGWDALLRDREERLRAWRQASDELLAVLAEFGVGTPEETYRDAPWLLVSDVSRALRAERQRAERAEAALRERDEDAERWRFVRLLLGGALGAGHSHDMDGPEMCLRIGEHVLGTGRTHGLTDDLVTAAVDRARPPAAPQAGGDDA